MSYSAFLQGNDPEVITCEVIVAWSNMDTGLVVKILALASKNVGVFFPVQPGIFFICIIQALHIYVSVYLALFAMLNCSQIHIILSFYTALTPLHNG